MSKILDEKENDQMFAAEELGHEFIKLHLNKKRIAGIQKEIHIHGVKRLNAYGRGQTDDGIQQFDFEPGSGIIKFKRSKEERAYIGYLWVDKGEGLYGKESYNIDFLATHIETGDFKIVDPKWQKIVQERYAHIKKILNEREANPVEEVVEVVTADMAVEDIDAKIAFLQKQREKATESVVPPKTEKATTSPKRGRPAKKKAEPKTAPINTEKTNEQILEGAT